MLWFMVLQLAHGLACAWSAVWALWPWLRRRVTPCTLGSRGELERRLLAAGGKLPHHLCLVVAEARVSPEDIARIAVWGMAAGIRHVSVWDRQGEGHHAQAPVHRDCLRPRSCSLQLRMPGLPFPPHLP